MDVKKGAVSLSSQTDAYVVNLAVRFSRGPTYGCMYELAAGDSAVDEPGGVACLGGLFCHCPGMSSAQEISEFETEQPG